MDNYIQQAALQWWKAEHPDRDLPSSCRGDIYAEAVPRVRRVFAGEVRWSEASPGDKAVWIGRPRDVAKFLTAESAWANFYDTVDLVPGEEPGARHLFDNTNVGDFSRTNLQIAGMAYGCGYGHHVYFDILQMYAITSRPLAPDDNVVVTMVIGTKVWAMSTLHFAILGVPVTVKIPPRQDFKVIVDKFEHRTRLAGPLTVRVHLEGQVHPAA